MKQVDDRLDKHTTANWSCCSHGSGL